MSLPDVGGRVKSLRTAISMSFSANLSTYSDTHRALGMILMRVWIAEIHQHTIAP